MLGKVFCNSDLIFNSLYMSVISLNISSKHRSFRNGILLPKLFRPTVRKKCSSGHENLLKFKAEGENFQNFEIIRTIYSNSERSEPFVVKECFLTCSWTFLRSNKLEQLGFNMEKKYWDLETCRKS